MLAGKKWKYYDILPSLAECKFILQVLGRITFKTTTTKNLPFCTLQIEKDTSVINRIKFQLLWIIFETNS